MFSFFKAKPSEAENRFQSLVGELTQAAPQRKAEILTELPLHVDSADKAAEYTAIYVKSPLILEDKAYLFISHLKNATVDKEILLKFINTVFLFCKNSNMPAVFALLLENTPQLYHISAFRAFFTVYKRVLAKAANPKDLFFSLAGLLPENTLPLLKDYKSLFGLSDAEILAYLKKGGWTGRKTALLGSALPESESEASEFYQKSGDAKLLKTLGLEALWGCKNLQSEEWQEAFLSKWGDALKNGHKQEAIAHALAQTAESEWRDSCLGLYARYALDSFIKLSAKLPEALFWENALKYPRLDKEFFALFPNFWQKEYPALTASSAPLSLINDVLTAAVKNTGGFGNWQANARTYCASKGLDAFINFMDTLQAKGLLEACIRGRPLDPELLCALSLRGKGYVLLFESPADLQEKALVLLKQNI